MAKERTFSVNSRHTISVVLNSGTGRFDTKVSDSQTNKVFERSLVLEQFNKLVDFFQENDHSFAMQSAHSYF